MLQERKIHVRTKQGKKLSKNLEYSFYSQKSNQTNHKVLFVLREKVLNKIYILVFEHEFKRKMLF